MLHAIRATLLLTAGLLLLRGPSGARAEEEKAPAFLALAHDGGLGGHAAPAPGAHQLPQLGLVQPREEVHPLQGGQAVASGDLGHGGSVLVNFAA